MIEIINNDCLVALKKIRDNSIDSIVTDPPYELGFMGKSWDKTGIAYNIDMWKECLRVLKPGGHLLSFGGTRTYHRMACAIEDAGFEIRDQIQWIYGSGFPKSLNIGVVVDKLQGNEREIIREIKTNSGGMAHISKTNAEHGFRPREYTGSSKDKSAKNVIKDTIGNFEWEGWGTALKPANEPICLARKPLSEKTIAENVLKWGTGGLNIDGSRIEYQNDNDKNSAIPQGRITTKVGAFAGRTQNGIDKELNKEEYEQKGRFPANVIHDGSEEVLNVFPDANGQQGDLTNHNHKIKSPNDIYGIFPSRYDAYKRNESEKSAARFFYCAKTSPFERNFGLENFPLKEGGMRSETSGQHITRRDGKDPKPTANNHPTVKPISLMSYLCKLITPPNGTVLDPFMGSGSTGIAAKLNNFNFIGIEKEFQYCKIAETRIEAQIKKPDESQLQINF